VTPGGIDSTFALSDAAAAFERSLASGKHGKVAILVAGERGRSDGFRRLLGSQPRNEKEDQS
jgi:hypothetical protein